MKIVYLNIWDGLLWDALAAFIKEKSGDTDVFCFQEVRKDTIGPLRELLPSYQDVFASVDKIPDDSFAQAIFVKQPFTIVASATVLDKAEEPGFALIATMTNGDDTVHVANVHGIGHPMKHDTLERLFQSRTIMEHMRGKVGPKIVGGDFNVSPETESLAMFKGEGYRELISDHKIRTTRNHFAWDRYPNDPMYYSDYVFVSPEITVTAFTVPENEISDHLPMIVEVEIIKHS